MSVVAKTLLAICLSGAAACTLDSSLKHRCNSDSDCLSGRVCRRSVCEASIPSDGLRPNYMFVTSKKVPPRFQPLEVADAICNTAAEDANLAGNYRAWLSTASVYARDRLVGARGWVRTDGAPFADTVDDITNGRIMTPPMLDEFGDEVVSTGVPSDMVATGTNSSGFNDPGNTCNEWANDEVTQMTVGMTIATVDVWTIATMVPCGTPIHLYCFGVDQSVPLTPLVASGKRAFVSAESFAPDTGVAAADALCSREAADSGLGGAFLALLGTTGFSPASRFPDSLFTTWVRVDGVALNKTGFDLFGSGLPRAPLNVTSRGEYIGNDLVPTGGGAPRAPPSSTDNCDDWTNTGGLAWAGRAARIDLWLYDTAVGCATPSTRVYCFER